MSQAVKDGQIWCEGCRDTLPNRREFALHRARCSGRDRLVENRAHGPSTVGGPKSVTALCSPIGRPGNTHATGVRP